MTEALLDPVRHNAWATRELLAFCRQLTPGQLEASAPGAMGTVRHTLEHLVNAEGSYWERVTGESPGWTPARDEVLTLDEIESRASGMATRWVDYVSRPFDPDRVLSEPYQGEVEEIPVGVVIAQLLNHGNEHRDQVCTVLTTLGISPPALDGWTYGEATGRIRTVTS